MQLILFNFALIISLDYTVKVCLLGIKQKHFLIIFAKKQSIAEKHLLVKWDLFSPC